MDPWGFIHEGDFIALSWRTFPLLEGLGYHLEQQIMRTLLWLALLLLMLLSVSCAGPEPEYRTNATVKDIMDSVVDPNADFLFKSVSTVITVKGVVEKAPHTDDDWKELRRHTVALMEATNLLQIPGRLVAQPGEKSENPQIELSPEVIKTLIDSDRASWIKHAHTLHDAGGAMMQAIAAKDSQKVAEAGDVIDKACEGCHKQYWYPDQRK